MKRSFFQAAVVSILLYGCTTWTLTKRLEKKLDGNYTRMLRAVLNKSWRQHPTRHQLYGHLPPITKTIQVRRTRHAGHCWRSTDELISDVLLWTPTYGRAKAGRPARTYIQQLCEDTGCNPEDLPEAMNDREKWRERVRDIRAGGTTWWWWWWWWLILYYWYKNIIIQGVSEKLIYFRNLISWRLFVYVEKQQKLLHNVLFYLFLGTGMPFTVKKKKVWILSIEFWVVLYMPFQFEIVLTTTGQVIWLRNNKDIRIRNNNNSSETPHPS